MPKVEILAPHGFCSGVKAAIETALRVLAVSGAEVYCLHELVHNEAVVADLKARGMHFVDDLVEIPQGFYSPPMESVPRFVERQFDEA